MPRPRTVVNTAVGLNRTRMSILLSFRIPNIIPNARFTPCAPPLRPAGTSRAPIDFKIKGEIPDFAAIAAVMNVKMMAIPAVRVDIAGGYDWQKLTFRKSTIEMRGNQMTLSGTVNWAGRRPRIEANISSPRISLIELFPGLYGGRRWRRPDRPLNVFHDIPLFGRELNMADVKLHAQIGDLIVYRDLTLSNIDLNGKIQDGTARIDGDVSIGGLTAKLMTMASSRCVRRGLANASMWGIY